MKLSFETLEQAHEFAETLEQDWVSIRNYAHALKNLQLNSNKKEERENAQWEIDFMQFMLDKGKVNPYMSGTDKEGQISEYPSFDNFTESTYNYLVDRIDKTRNNLLIARFSQIMWNSPLKSAKFAKSAIDAYIIILSGGKFSKGRDRDGYNIYFNALYLSAKVNYKFQFLLGMVDDDSLFCEEDRVSIYVGFLDLKNVKVKHVLGYIELLDSVITKKYEDKDFSGLEWALNIAIKLAKKCSNDTKRYRSLLAECYVGSAEERMTDTSLMIPIQLYSQALEIYQQLNDNIKSEEISLKIVELRQDFKLGSVRTEFSEAESKLIFDYFNAKADRFLDRDIDEFFNLLINGIEMFPNADDLRNKISQEKQSLIDLFSKSYVDINNNQRKGAEDKLDKEKQKLYEQYGLFVTMEVGLFMEILFRKGIASGQLSYQTIINQFEKRTWLGFTYQQRSGGGEIEQYSWLSLLAPSLFEYFRQEEAGILSHKYKPNHILVIDSLTLKFEGVLRDFARLIGAPTIRYSKKAQGEREMYIEDLLGNKKVQEYFDENDRMLFKYLFLNEGINLRNNVSHCFLKYHDYKNAHVYLLIAAFLRIGKYQINSGK